MRHRVWITALAVALVASASGLAAEPQCCEPSQDVFLKQVAPAGGWFPYGGGLLHWWNPGCFPRCGAPDDYCRKPLPPVCRPPYPCFYTWGPPEISCPQSNSPLNHNKPCCLP
jgi:hypothetical protein